MGLPARGRSICGDLAWTALGTRVSELVARSVCYRNLDGKEVRTASPDPPCAAATGNVLAQRFSFSVAVGVRVALCVAVRVRVGGGFLAGACAREQCGGPR